MSENLVCVVALDIHEQEVDLWLEAPNTGASPTASSHSCNIFWEHPQTGLLHKLTYAGEEDGYHLFALPSSEACFRVPC